MPRDSFRYSSPPATPPAAPLDSPFDALAREIVCPSRSSGVERENEAEARRRRAFEAQMQAFMGDEKDPLVRELRRQAFLVGYLALDRLKLAERPYDWACHHPTWEERERDLKQGVTLMKLYQSQVEAVRRWKALPEGSTFNQVFVQQGGNTNDENSIACEAQIVSPEPGHEGERQCLEERDVYEGETSGETELLEASTNSSEDTEWAVGENFK